MTKSSEQFNTYSEEEAIDEAQKMHEKIESGESKNYTEAEKLVESETKHGAKKQQNSNSSELQFIGDHERQEKMERPIRVTNFLEEMGLPSRQHIEGHEMTPNQSVVIDSRALRNRDCAYICFGKPHAGEFVPMSISERLTEDGKRDMAIIDRGTMDIFTSERIPSVATRITRFIADPNRNPSPSSKTGGAPGEVLWRKSFSGKNMYKEREEPTEEEARELTELFYTHYYNNIMGVIGSLTDRREKETDRVLVIDGHSFPVSENEVFKKICEHYGIESSKELPLFILGDNDGKSCDPDIITVFVEALKENFKALSEEDQEALLRNSTSKRIVAVNEFLKGARNVEFYRSREHGVNSFQLELNNGAFIDEVNGDYYNASYNMKNLNIMHDLIEKTCMDIDHILKKSCV